MLFRLIKPLRHWLASCSQTFLVALGVVLLSLLWTTETLYGPELPLSFLSIIPIMIVASYAGLWPGIAVAALAGVGILAIEWQAGGGSPRALLVRFAVRTFVLVLVADVMASLSDILLRIHGRSQFDGLTGVLNSRAFVKRTILELKRLKQQGKPLTLAYLDVDDFKAANDQCGHSAGDGLLCAVSGVLKGATRSSDVVARIGGDEFVVLLPDANRETAERILGRLRGELDFVVHRGGWPVGFSIGAVSYDHPPCSVDVLINQADRVMYEAKRAGRNCTRFVTQEAIQTPV